MAGKSQRILVIHRYFWPDTAPVAAILRSICDTLADEGHDVTVLTSQPCYKPEIEIPPQPKREQLGQVNVQRISLLKEKRGANLRKAINFILFECIAAVRTLFGPKRDIVMALSFPPVINGAVFRWMAKLRGSKFFYHIMDLHPESMRFSGSLSDGLLYRLARKVDARTCQQAERVIVLSDDMATMMQTRPGLKNSNNVRVIANFNIPDYGQGEVAVPEQFKKLPDKFRLIFAGNIGNYQALPDLVEAAKLTSHRPDIEWIFLGEGAAKQQLIQQAGDSNGKTIHFFPHQSPAIADAIVADADLAIVSLSPGIIRVANPCKTSTYLSMGCPLLVVVEPESGLFQTCQRFQLGFACCPGQSQDLADVVIDAVDGNHNYEQMRKRTISYANEHLARPVLLDRWRSMLREIN